MSSLFDGHWIEVRDGDARALALMKHHYTWHNYKDGRSHRRFVGPGEKMVLITLQCDALFIWRLFRESGHKEPKGVCCAVFRNEGNLLSSDLIKEAVTLALKRWPDQRLYTYVNPKIVKGDGKCFKAAGWRKLSRRTKIHNLIELELV